MVYLLLSPPNGTNYPSTPNTTPPTPSPPSPASSVVGNDNVGADNNDSNNDGGELAEASGIGIDPFPPIIIPKSSLPTFQLQLPLPLLTPPPSSPSSPLSPMFPSLSLSQPLLPPPPDLPLRSPCKLLQCNIDPDPDLNPDFNLVVDAPKAAVPLDVFLPLLRRGLDLDPDLVLALQEFTGGTERQIWGRRRKRL